MYAILNLKTNTKLMRASRDSLVTFDNQQDAQDFLDELLKRNAEHKLNEKLTRGEFIVIKL